MPDGEHGNRDPLQHDQRGQLLQAGHRRLAVMPVSSSLHRPMIAYGRGYSVHFFSRSKVSTADRRRRVRRSRSNRRAPAFGRGSRAIPERAR
jgi:hypothetical protein